MEKGAGTALPIHLQIIDLDIDKASVTFDQDELNALEGYDSLSITASPVLGSSNIAIDNVALYLDDQLVSTLNVEPYIWSEKDALLQNLVAGNYTLKAVVTDDSSKTVEVSTTLNVVDPTPSVSFVQAAQTLTEGYQSLSIEAGASTPIADRSIASVALFVDDTQVSSKTSAPYTWTQDETQLQGLAAGTWTIKAVVTDSQGLTAETTQTLTITADTTPPAVAFSQSAMTKTEGYTDITIGVTASTTNASATIASVTLYINDSLVSEETSANYQWTQAHAKLMNLAPGTHNAKVVATDTKGQTAEATMTITVQAQPVNNGNTGGSSAGGSSGGGGALNLLLLAVIASIAFRKKHTRKNFN